MTADICSGSRPPRVAFIIPVHPLTEQGEDQRRFLFENSVHCLIRQSYPEWIALFVGRDGDWIHTLEKDDRLRPLRCREPGSAGKKTAEHPGVGDKGLRIETALEFLNQGSGVDWIARLDDDDMISSCVLADLFASGEDLPSTVYGVRDSGLHMYDRDSGRFFREPLPWTANTVLMRYPLARAFLSGPHAAFGLRHIPDRRWHILPEDRPLYVRVLHAESVTGVTLAKRLAEKADRVRLLDSPPPGFCAPPGNPGGGFSRPDASGNP